MIGVLFILFNLSLYYTLSGFFLYMFFEVRPLVWGIPILLSVSILFMVLRAKVFPLLKGQSQGQPKGQPPPVYERAIVISLCALPLVFLAFSPSMLQILHFLPAWSLTAVILFTGRVNIEHEAFKSHFSFTGRFYLLLIFAIFGFELIVSSLVSIILYFIIYLMSGMTLLRILRQDGQLSKSPNIIVMLGLLIFGILFAVLNLQQALAFGIGLLYQGVAWLIVAVSMAILYALSFIVNLLNISVTVTDGGFTEGNLSYAEYPEADELAALAGEYTVQIPEWLPIVVISIVFAVLALLLARHFLKKARKGISDNSDSIKEEEHGLLKSQYKKRNKRKIFRPSDPREAVRWYYRKYLKAGISRGAQKPLSSDTSDIINKSYSSFFPSNESKELRELYIEARYQNDSEIKKQTADNAAAIWKRL